ncbi:MAG TPA: serine hydrolase domain-containing protein [Pyrinomonadaceae bacterium]|nr:serine hydrolase domain-containing protein [Pyrinomonadaceae bacterium]
MRSRKNIPLILSLIVCVLVGVAAARADEVDDYVREQMRRRHVPGLALAVVRDGKLVKARGYGLASVELNVPVRVETVFEIGSVTKQITAAAVMLLAEEGKLGLDDPLGKHLPGTPDAWGAITVRHLLTHTSGLKNYTGLRGFELTERLKREDFIRLVAAHPLAFAPGDAHAYGNTNYSLLGYVVEAVSGRPYWQFVTERIFKPLGMNATRDRDPHHLIPNRAVGYEWEDGRLVGRDYDLTDVFSAGATVSTVLDLVKWDAALAGEKLLKKSSLEQVWTPTRLNDGTTHPYGLGWYVENVRGHGRVRHNGQTAGFAASIARYREKRVTVIVLTNLGTLGLAGRINQGVAKHYLPALSLKRLGEQTDPDPQTSTRLRSALAELLAGRVEPAAFTSARAAALSTANAKESWREIASYGPLKSLAFVEREPSNKSRTLRYKAALGEHLLLLKFVLEDDGRIAEVNVEEEE